MNIQQRTFSVFVSLVCLGQSEAFALQMYWVAIDLTQVARADTDGNNVQDLITAGLIAPLGIVLDPAGGHMY